MNSKTHIAEGPPQRLRMLRTPCASTTTISPGSMSRTNSAPTASNAQDSLAKRMLSPMRPIHSGRKPTGSRTAINLLGEEMTRL